MRLWPRGRADIFDLALAGRTATVAAIEQDYENRIHLAVTALGFGSVECAGFYDAEMLDLLGLSPGTNAVIHTVVMGVPPSGER